MLDERAGLFHAIRRESTEMRCGLADCTLDWLEGQFDADGAV